MLSSEKQAVVCSGSGAEQKAAAPSVLHRRSANYQPNTWDYDSICSLHDQQHPVHGNKQLQPSTENSVQTSLKDRVRQLLLLEEKDEEELPPAAAAARLRVIDQLQSLGVAYHFDEEIKSILISISHHDLKDDLCSTALLFRMLRGHGVPASADMLSAFRSRHEQNDVDALISLYEASYLAFPGETMLDEARAFAVETLKEMTRVPSSVSEPRQRERIDGILSGCLPLHWRAPRLQALWSLKQQHCEDDNEDGILQLAADDFNLVQSVHRRELERITRWWKDTGLGEKLPFARDRLVECFFCAACIAPEPRLEASREVLAKVSSLIIHLDDIYDVYGTLHELTAFTNAIGRWDTTNVVVTAEDDLPEYMKAMYSAIVATSVSAADNVTRDQQDYNVLPLFKRAWHELCKAFLVEATWQQRGYTPGLDEYLDNGWITSTGPLLLLHAFPMHHHHCSCSWRDKTKNDRGFAYPRMVELSSRIFQLCNDCSTHKAESERGDAPSAIACYMMERQASEEEAHDGVRDAIGETWKELNREAASVALAGGSPAAAMSSLNLARIIHCIYHDREDAITSPTQHRKQLIMDMLFTPYIPYRSSSYISAMQH
ncbi:hypothetical protein ABZP36_002262 [Zizania latifolia]